MRTRLRNVSAFLPSKTRTYPQFWHPWLDVNKDRMIFYYSRVISISERGLAEIAALQLCKIL